jgi:hypothetical protein
MWTAPADKPKLTPRDADENFVNRPQSRPLHLPDVQKLAGSFQGRKVLDLGGGSLLADAGLLTSCDYTLVDVSQAVCGYVSGKVPQSKVVCADALTYLWKCDDTFDVVLCFGILEYCHPGALADLCCCCPSNVLCLGVSVGESYLQYAYRVTAYSKRDVEEITSDAGYRRVIDLNLSSHVWARFERID